MPVHTDGVTVHTKHTHTYEAEDVSYRSDAPVVTLTNATRSGVDESVEWMEIPLGEVKKIIPQ